MTESRIQVGASQDYLNTNKVTTGAGAVHNEIVEQYAFESTTNTTTTPLGSAETFTGDFEQNDQECVMVSCQTDNTGTLYFDFSVDGTNYSTFPVSGFAVASGIHEFHTAVKGPRYFRVRFVNDSGAQTYLRLYTYFGTFRAANTPLNQSVGLDSDALPTRPTDTQDEIVRGLRSGVSAWNKFGYRNGLTAAGGDETIWATTGNFTPMSAASTYTITYNSGTDGLGTTGALTLYFQYINSAGLPAVSVHTLSNTGSDVTSFSGLGINRIAVSSSGSAQTNTNAITITATTGGAKQAIIPALSGVTQQSIYHVGSNHTAIMKHIRIHVSTTTKTPVILIKGYVWNRNVATRYEVVRDIMDTSSSLVHDLIDPIGFKLNATDVLYFVADTDANGVDISIRFGLNEYQLT